MKLRKGDQVIITAGKDRGKRGKIETLFPKDQMILLSGLNIYKRHLKRRDEKNPGGIIDVSRPLPLANVSLICPKCHQITRLGYKLQGKEKQRLCKKCQQII